MLLLKSNGAKDFYSGLTPTKSGATALSLDEHHIFPVNSKIGKLIVKNYAGTSNSDIINNVANLALITNETNRKRIREKNPSVYITQFEDEYIKAGKQKEFLEIMKSQFISPKMILLLKDDKFEEFIYERTMLIEKQIEKLCS
ncbi:MAG TPA: hypothetical protein PLM49_03795 [Bacteroidales bacterium]|nr:hypothetical protein [Bacteroidales bacterium]